jgi:hypothetical protein
MLDGDYGPFYTGAFDEWRRGPGHRILIHYPIPKLKFKPLFLNS